MNNKQPDKSPAERATDVLRDFADILAAPDGSLVIYKAGPVVRHGLIVTVEQSGVWFDGGCAPVPFSDILYIIPDPAEFVERARALLTKLDGWAALQMPGNEAEADEVRNVLAMIQGGG